MITIDIDSLNNLQLIDSNGERYRIVKIDEQPKQNNYYINQTDVRQMYTASYRTLNELEQQGLLETIKVGKFRRYSVASLDNLAKQGKLKKRPLA